MAGAAANRDPAVGNEKTAIEPGQQLPGQVQAFGNGRLHQQPPVSLGQFPQQFSVERRKKRVAQPGASSASATGSAKGRRPSSNSGSAPAISSRSGRHTVAVTTSDHEAPPPWHRRARSRRDRISARP